MADTITQTYRSMLAALHETDVNWGSYVDPGFKTLAADIAQEVNAESILDYGCGKCDLGLPNLSRYDPAIPGIDQPPEPADLVIATCMLEHVEPDCLDATLDDMARCTKKAALIVVSCFSSAKTLSDGRNAHLLIKPIDWWLPHLMKRWDINTASVMPQRFWFLGMAKKSG